MSAGSGVTHEEMPERKAIGTIQDVYFVQLWIALPEQFENRQPTFEVHRQSEIPEVEFEDAYAWLLIGEAWEKCAPTTQHSKTILSDLLIEPGGSISTLPDFEERAVYLLEGRASLDDEALDAHRLAVIEPGSDPVLRSDEGCRALLLGGDKFPSARFVSGSFVGSSKAFVTQKTRAFQKGEFPKLSDVDAGLSDRSHSFFGDQ